MVALDLDDRPPAAAQRQRVGAASASPARRWRAYGTEQRRLRRLPAPPDAAWVVDDLAYAQAFATVAGLRPAAVDEMPADNLTLVSEKAGKT